MRNGESAKRRPPNGMDPSIDDTFLQMSGDHRMVIPRPHVTDGVDLPLRRISQPGKGYLDGIANPAFDRHESSVGGDISLIHRHRASDNGMGLEFGGKPSSSMPAKLEPINDSEEDDEDEGCLNRAINGFYGRIDKFAEDNSGKIRIALIALFAIAYNVYLGAVIVHTYNKDEPVQWCDGSGFLFAVTGVVYVGLLYFQVIKRFFGKFLERTVVKPFSAAVDAIFSYRASKVIAYGLLIAGIIVFVIIDTWEAQHRLRSGLGVIVLVFLGFIFSRHPGKVVWRHVIWGLGLQFGFALLVLRWPFGRDVLDCLSSKVSSFLQQANEGSKFVYGYLVDGMVSVQNITYGVNPGHNVTQLISDEILSSGVQVTLNSTIFAFGVLSVIFFFSFVIQMLYYYGAMQWMVAKIGWMLQVTIGTTAAESLSASANIFVGQTEAPLMVKPYLGIMTKSELHAIMTGGFATVAGTVLAAYISFGVSAAHILAASVMSAPAALAISKLVYPETEKSKTTADEVGNINLEDHANVLDAAASGASQAISLVMNIIANLIAFTAFVFFLDTLVNWFAMQVGYDIDFTWIIGKIFMPLAWTMGVDWQDCDEVGELVGIKTIVNEFVAYKRLQDFEGKISERSKLISTYALCGFSNIAGIGIQLGGLSALAPQRKSDLSEIALRALMSGSMACFLTACIAGLLVDT